MRGAEFQHADLQGAHFNEAHLPETQWKEADLAGTDFTDAHLGRDDLNAILEAKDKAVTALFSEQDADWLRLKREAAQTDEAGS